MAFYAVKCGRVPGIYKKWDDCKQQIEGFAFARYKKFLKEEEAKAFINEDSNKRKTEELSTLTPTKKVLLSSNAVFTDGSALNNGKPNARGGVGVYFGKNDPRNISERLNGPRQTNQRAEVTAIIRALEVFPKNESLKIYTDSSYSINAITVWSKKWKQNGYKCVSGKPVENSDLFIYIDELLNQRSANTEFIHVFGHSGVEGNIEADQLAQQGARK